MDAKVFDLVERDGLVLAGPLVGRLVPLGVGAERPQVHLARRDGPHRVDDDGHEGVLEAVWGIMKEFADLMVNR